MGLNKTGIEWVRGLDGSQGFTSNPIRGKCPVGCSYCYVEFDRKRWGWPEEVSWHPEELGRIIRRNKPAGIFIGSTHEIFWPAYHQWTCDILQCIRICEQHLFYILTKRPYDMMSFSPFPDNCRVGVTATDHLSFAEAYFSLNRMVARHKYISLEPFHSWDKRVTKAMIHQAKQAGVEWLIIGAQTKPTIYPDITHVHDIVDAAVKEGVAVFLKDNLRPAIAKYNRQACDDCEAGDPCGYCGETLPFLQEMPDA